MLKIVAMGKEYFKNRWNVFDFIIVVFSIVEIIVSTSINNANIDGLTILRVLRLVSSIAVNAHKNFRSGAKKLKVWLKGRKRG